MEISLSSKQSAHAQVHLGVTCSEPSTLYKNNGADLAHGAKFVGDGHGRSVGLEVIQNWAQPLAVLPIELRDLGRGAFRPNFRLFLSPNTGAEPTRELKHKRTLKKTVTCFLPHRK